MAKLSKAELARRTVRDVYVELSDGDRLDDLLAQHGPGCWFNFDYGYYDDPTTVYLVRDREENDEEYNARLDELKAIKAAEEARRRKAKADLEAKERETYERLKKKFKD